MRTIWFLIVHALEVALWVAAIGTVIGFVTVPLEDFIIYQTVAIGAVIATLITPHSTVLSYIGYTLCAIAATIATGLWVTDSQFMFEQFSTAASVVGYQYFGLIVLRGLYEPIVRKIRDGQQSKYMNTSARCHLLVSISVRAIGAGFFILSATVLPTAIAYVWLLILAIPVQLYLYQQLR